MFRGSKGFTDATEFKEILKVDSRIKFEKVFRFELRDSIVNLMKQHILIEVWESNSFSKNQLKDGRKNISFFPVSEKYFFARS